MFPFKPAEAFAINKDLDIENLTMEGTNNTVVIADNFYQNPDIVRDLILKTPYPVWKDRPGTRNFIDYFDCRQSQKLPYLEAQQAVKQIAEEFLHIEVHSPASFFNTNIFRLINDQPENSQAFPHDDGNLLTALVMLNTEQECSGGTAFYRSKNPPLDRMPADPIIHEKVHKKIFTTDNYETGSQYFMENFDKYWEVLGVVPMVYNRLLVYPGVMFHGAWHLHNSFKNHFRINQAMFIDDVTYKHDFWCDK